jgi:choline dehydrogenase-like flavoprotein
MIISSAQAESGEYDVCIVGTGPAGLPLALELCRINPSWRILLLEYGGPTKAANALDASIVIETPSTHHEPEDCTNKCLGGTSLTWGGRCVNYDDIDFMPRPIVGNECTWDRSVFASAKAHFSRAGEMLDCGNPVFNLHEMEGPTSSRIAPGFVEGVVTDSIVERWSMPTRLGSKYRRAIEGHTKIEFLQSAKADKIVMAGSTGGVAAISVIDRDSNRAFDVSARLFVIAAGAQETTRLLLKSADVFQKLGGIPPSLGRYYQGHVSGKIATVKFNGDPKKTDFGFCRDQDGVYIRRRFQFSKETLLTENLLNTAFWLDNPPYYDPQHGSGTMSLIYLAMVTPVIGSRLAPGAIAESVTKGKRIRVGRHMANVVKGLPMSLLEPAAIFVKRYLRKRKLPGVFLYNRKNEYALHFHAEQQPVRENRMYLGSDGEELRITYSYTPEDIESVLRCHRLLDASLQQSGAGQLRYWYPESDLPDKIASQSKDGIHQVGTTRMSMRQEDGVVDPDLRVWGTDNLYVCSSSAFPTSGQANPTFLLTAFALRLAAHLSTK